MTAQFLSSLSPSRRNLLGAAIIAIAAAIVYAPSMSGPFLLDDDLLLTQSRLIEAPDGLYRIWFTSEPVDYWPVTNTSLWLEWRAWRYDTTGYKATNLILHVAGSLLIWATLARLSIPGAWLAALAFAVHPINVESVAWIAQRKNVLSLLFFVGSIYAFVRYDDDRSNPENARGRPKLWYSLSLIAFLLAMLSKASVVTLPLVLAGIVISRRRIGRNDILRLAPFFVLAGGLTLLNLWFRSHGQDIEIREVSFLDRILGAAAAIWFYLGKAIAPVNLAFIYPQWNVNADEWLWWRPLVVAIGVTVLFWFYRRTWARPWWFAWLYFAVTLLPALGFIDAGYMKFALVADHYQYLSLIGVVGLAAALWSRWRQRTFKSSPNAADYVAIAVIGSLMLLCWIQNGLYADNLKLYTDAIEKNPNSHILHALIGYSHEERGRLDLAAGNYRRAAELKPTEPTYFNSLGVAQAHLGQYPEAVVNFERATKLRPDMAECYRNTAWAISNLGKWKEAVELCQHAVKLDPHDYRALRFLGIALLKNNQTQEAARQFQTCLEIDPNDAEIGWYLATAQTALGEKSTALATAERALKLAREQQQSLLMQQIESLLRSLQSGESTK